MESKLVDCLPADEKELIDFFSGNPFVEISKGTIHFYKNNTNADGAASSSKTVCLLAVPASLTCHDILNFVAPSQAALQQIRIIRDATPNQFMVLLDFRTVESAIEFYEAYNGAPFNSLEETVCRAVWVSSVEWGHSGTGSPPVNHTELPTCPVCLERMDESIDGVLMILCTHTFHTNCLVKWGDSTCPVCRHVQTPEMVENSACMECESIEDIWICLLCGHLGCSRYRGGHAATHFRDTSHNYALQLGSNRVWDYAGDNFVHRLMQNKSDGKLVASPGCGDQQDEGKIDSIQLEFTHLLTSQLAMQRKYFENKLESVQTKHDEDVKDLQDLHETLKARSVEVEAELDSTTKLKMALKKRLDISLEKIKAVNKERLNDQAMAAELMKNLTLWKEKYIQLQHEYAEYQTEKEAEVKELNEQVRDLMFFMDAKNQFEKLDMQDELEGAQVVIPEAKEDVSKTRKKKK